MEQYEFHAENIWFIFSMGIFLVLLLWDRFSIFLLKKRISILENKLGIKTDKYGDECE